MTESRRVKMDNVIYANFGNKKRVSTPEDRVQVINKSRDKQFSPAGHRTVMLTEKNADSGRRSRGEQYYRNGNVTGITVMEGRVECTVAGSQNEPFTTTVTFPYRSSDKLREAYAAIADTPNGLRLVREGHLTSSMLDHLVGNPEESIYFDCTCPDRSLVCKHAVASAYYVAEKMTSNPALILDIRGQGLAGLEALIRTYHTKVDTEPEDNDSFWNGKELPSLPDPKIASAIDDSDINYLHKALRLISYTSLEQLRAVSDIEDMYEILVSNHPDNQRVYEEEDTD
ncbi:2-oxo acid dehydrogenase [Corynebacterium crudilactis]|uniref:2-oxo acid dehydrogenase n=1 Tax=Corynebacterium crudilactis TaxID=1652495 RepID=A0A172QSR0_9CORY|nr:2-oxo acid dehydrogenase [Corynebacterium crudilactis]ANE03735.1 2-oxo acid dehydrogenase [Corynebacterium crudilactis]